MANNPNNDDIYEAHDPDNDHAGENDPLLVRSDSPSSVDIEAHGPPPHAKPKHNAHAHPRFPSAALLVPILILLVGIGTLGAGVTTHLTSCSVRPDQSEKIANLTTRLDATKASLDVCTRNSTRLGLDLSTERVRLTVCRENGKRLAERVDKVEGDLELCTNQKLLLEDELKDVKSKEEACEIENDQLKRQVEGGAFIDFEGFVGSLGTGGDSWVCSDATLSWSYGYVSEQTPHPTITISTWTAELTDTQHSAIPLVFPPSAVPDNYPVPPSPPSPPPYPPGYPEIATSQEVVLRPKSSAYPLPPTGLPTSLARRASDPRLTLSTAADASIYILGYIVTSKNTSGNNGWWRITKMDRFGSKDGRIEFWALAAKWYGSKSQYDVKVWYTER